jgi:hypothetical protein
MTNNDEDEVAVIAQAVEELKMKPVGDAEFKGAFTFGNPNPQTRERCLELLETGFLEIARTSSSPSRDFQKRVSRNSRQVSRVCGLVT